jgi:hypothetical protein
MARGDYGKSFIKEFRIAHFLTAYRLATKIVIKTVALEKSSFSGKEVVKDVS